MGGKDKFEIIELDGRLVVKQTYYGIEKSVHKMFYEPYGDSDEIQLTAFECVKKLARAENEQGDGMIYDIILDDIKYISGIGTQSTEYVSGGRFRGIISRKINVESRRNYGGPCYNTFLEIATNNIDSEAAGFIFRAPKFATSKAKKNAEEVLTNLLLDVLQLKKK